MAKRVAMTVLERTRNKYPKAPSPSAQSTVEALAQSSSVKRIMVSFVDYPMMGVKAGQCTMVRRCSVDAVKAGIWI